VKLGATVSEVGGSQFILWAVRARMGLKQSLRAHLSSEKMTYQGPVCLYERFANLAYPETTLCAFGFCIRALRHKCRFDTEPSRS
jgi:hypothetical protein